MNDTVWLLWGVRIAGGFHFVTLVMACFTPIPPDWEKNLAHLPETHRRFAVAQNFFIGATLAFLGFVSLCFAPALLDGSPTARLLCAATALWWGGRLLILPWLRVTPHLQNRWLRLGFITLQIECALYALAYGWLACR